jgi:hypothetical protein
MAVHSRKETETMAKVKSGGGFNKRVEVGVRAGPPQTNVINKSAVAHLGNKVGSHITEGGDILRKKEPLVKGTASQVRSGNDVAASTVCGVGGSRTIYRTGSQGTHGNVNPGSSPPRTDILSGYGPEKKVG